MLPCMLSYMCLSKCSGSRFEPLGGGHAPHPKQAAASPSAPWPFVRPFCSGGHRRLIGFNPNSQLGRMSPYLQGRVLR